MKKFAWLIAAFWLGFTISAGDKLDEIEELVDAIERGYWTTLRMGGESRRTMENRISSTLKLARDVQSETRASGNADLTYSLLVLQRVFSDVRPADLQKFNLKFRTTTMRDYRPQYRRWLREQQENESRDSEEPDARRKKRRIDTDPDLTNVDPEEYGNWVTEIVNDNLEKVRTSSRNPSSREEKTRDRIVEYHHAILSLRLGMVELRRAYGADHFK